MHARSATQTRAAVDMAATTASVLVIDGDDDARDLLGALLSRRGYHVTTCSDGEEALAYLRSERPAVVLLDSEALHADELREGLHQDIALIEMTMGEPCERQHLVKPLHLDDVIRVIEDIRVS